MGYVGRPSDPQPSVFDYALLIFGLIVFLLVNWFGFGEMCRDFGVE